MRIWMINHYALSPGRAGGTRHYTLARNLVELGHDVTIVASDYNHWTRQHEHVSGKSCGIETIHGVRFVWLKTPGYKRNLARLYSMFSFACRVRLGKWRKQLDSPDIIIGSSPHLFAALAAQRVASQLHVPFVVEVRDIWPQSLIDLGGLSPRHPLMLLMKQIELFLYRSASRIISLLPGAKEYFLQNGAKMEQLFWLPNGVDMEKTPQPVALDDTKETFTIIYAGTIGLANGLDTLLDAALQLQKLNKPVSFLLVGNGPQKEVLLQKAHKEGIENVSFMDPVPKNEIHALIALADACIMLLKDSPVFKWGVSPNKLFDYMATARPVLFGVSTPYNIVEQAKCGITFKPENSESLCEAILAMFQLQTRQLNTMGGNGYEYVSTHHDHKKNALKLAGEFDSILIESGE